MSTGNNMSINNKTITEDNNPNNLYIGAGVFHPHHPDWGVGVVVENFGQYLVVHARMNNKLGSTIYELDTANDWQLLQDVDHDDLIDKNAALEKELATVKDQNERMESLLHEAKQLLHTSQHLLTEIAKRMDG